MSIISVFFISCKKEEPGFQEITYCGSAKAEMNGEEWSTTKINGRQLNNTDTTFTLVMYEESNGLDVLFQNFINIPFREEVYDVYKLEKVDRINTIFSFLDGDALLARHVLLESDTSNHITIDKYNPETRQVKGRFHATYVIVPPNPWNMPDTVRFTNGQFSTQILEW
ncbi:MAG: hypothetical protein AB8H03_20495 [Saprospiraceae bacterium]